MLGRSHRVATSQRAQRRRRRDRACAERPDAVSRRRRRQSGEGQDRECAEGWKKPEDNDVGGKDQAILNTDIVPVYQIKGISKLFKLCLPKVQCFCDSLTSPPSERQFNALLMSVASLLANVCFPGCCVGMCCRRQEKMEVCRNELCRWMRRVIMASGQGEDEKKEATPQTTSSIRYLDVYRHVSPEVKGQVYLDREAPDLCYLFKCNSTKYRITPRPITIWKTKSTTKLDELDRELNLVQEEINKLLSGDMAVKFKEEIDAELFKWEGDVVNRKTKKYQPLKDLHLFSRKLILTRLHSKDDPRCTSDTAQDLEIISALEELESESYPVETLPSHVRDTTDVLRRLDGMYLEPDMLLVTADVESLYTCIDHEEGLMASQFFLEASNIDPDVRSLGTVQDLDLFMLDLNRNDSNIRLTYTYHKREISFLDINIQVREDGSVVTDVFRKETSFLRLCTLYDSLIELIASHMWRSMRIMPYYPEYGLQPFMIPVKHQAVKETQFGNILMKLLRLSKRVLAGRNDGGLCWMKDEGLHLETSLVPDPCSNLSISERQALKSLQQDKDLIIKPADKGGAIVVMDKSLYKTQVHCQLSHSATYRTLPANPTSQTQRLIQATLDRFQHLGILDTMTRDFLTKKHPITPVMYILPKIHKNLQNPHGRPIVASTDSLVAPISIYLEKILTPLVCNTSSFLLDTGAFLTTIHDISPVPPDTILVSFDVKDLYTSIPHSNGIESTRWLLSTSNIDPILIDFCCDLLSIVLTNIFFLFEDTYYLQIKGSAMGSNVAPPYANAYIAHFEDTLIYAHNLFYSHCVFLKTSWPGLDFTMTYHHTQISFLDTLIIKDDHGSLSTDLYFKPTDRNSLLHYDSFHPCSIKNPIPKSQIHRVDKIVSDPHLKDIRINEMKRARNIRDILVSADIGPARFSPSQHFLRNPKTGTFPCLNCNQCSNVLRGDIIHHPHIGKRYINHFFTCDLNFIVYLLKCPCGLLYVGETTQSVKDRISKHKSTIRCKNLLLPIPHHFLSKGHSVSQLRFQVIEQVTPPRCGGNRISILKQREAFWIHKLNALTPKGLNRDHDLQSLITLMKVFTDRNEIEGFELI
ncbi:unnamed protein product, partial [Ranitomeya imitator]